VFEFDKFDPKRHISRSTIPLKLIQPPVSARESSFLLWGEHCIECAAPECYKTCDLYEPRPDLRCRRFEFGAAPDAEIRGSRGAGAEIVFRKWAKLEARGNTFLVDAGNLEKVERGALWLSRLTNVIGRFMAVLSRDLRWNYATFSIFERLNRRLRQKELENHPDGFLFEAHNPSDSPVELVLMMSIDRSNLRRELSPDSIPRPFTRRITLEPGPHRQLFQYVEFRDIVESRLPFNISITPEAKEGTRVIFQNLDFVKLSDSDREELQTERVGTPVAVTPVKRAGGAKCVVFDLDNTLWEGVLLETDEVRLKSFVPGLLKSLDERGILLSVASKNERTHAASKLTSLGIDEYFLYPKVNWAPKSENIRQIAKDLDIGLDTFIFVDDNEFELSEVSSSLPMVECISVDGLSSLLSHTRLQGSTTSEAGTRRKMYREAMARTELEQSFGGDYTEFLRSCNIRVTIRPNEPADAERITELVQRTNQLNFSGRKYSREEVLTMISDPDIERYVLTCEDKFGAYGTIGFCVVRRRGSVARIEDLMLSCRVQGKLIEAVLFDHICSRGPESTERLEVNFRTTDRNLPAQQVLTKLGFPIQGAPEVARSVQPGSFAVDFITTSTT
jgi:FkbH-like protein